MSRVSDERLERLIELWRPEITGTGDFGEATELCAALRELKSYRKAVREYLEAVDAVHAKCFEDDDCDELGYDENGEKHPLLKAFDAAEANLRALERGEEVKARGEGK